MQFPIIANYVALVHHRLVLSHRLPLFRTQRSQYMMQPPIDPLNKVNTIGLLTYSDRVVHAFEMGNIVCELDELLLFIFYLYPR